MTDTADDPALYAELNTVFTRALGRRITVGPDTKLMTLPGFDSLRAIEIIIAIERQFAITFGSDAIDDMRVGADIVRAIAASRTP